VEKYLKTSGMATAPLSAVTVVTFFVVTKFIAEK